MATGQDQRVLRQLGTLLSVGTAGELNDGQLLERFATRAGDSAEQAFATLVERHGPMVLRVCRGVLIDPNDVEDAFQATFLVLVKKARSLWVSDSLGPWLHQVALRTASCARSAAARRKGTSGLQPSRCECHTPRAATTWGTCCTRRSTGCPNASGCRSFSATSRGVPTSRRRGIWAGQSERSRAA